MRIVGDDEALARCAVGAARLDAEGRAVAAETGAKLDAQVCAGDLDRGAPVVVYERLGLVARPAGERGCAISAHRRPTFEDDSHADGRSSGQLALDGPAQVAAFRVLPRDGSCAIVVAGDGRGMGDRQETAEEDGGEGADTHVARQWGLMRLDVELFEAELSGCGNRWITRRWLRMSLIYT